MTPVFEGLLGHERMMLVCGAIAFVFALAIIGVMVAQRRNFLPATVVLVFAVVLMGFPGIKAVQFSKDMVSLETLRAQPPEVALQPEAREEYARTLAQIERRAGDDPVLRAKVADGFRVIGETERAFALADDVLQAQPSAEARDVLVPVLTERLEEAVPADPTTTPTAAERERIAQAARQLQTQAAVTALPADAYVVLAQAQVALGETQRAEASLQQAAQIDPAVRISPRLDQAIREHRAFERQR